jgi:hypothetical protein
MSAQYRNVTLCKIEVTIPRVLGSRGVRRGRVVDEQAEFSCLEVQLWVQSGRLRVSVSDACVLIGLQRRQGFRLLRGLRQDGPASLPSKHPRQTQQPSVSCRGSHPGVVDRARPIRRFWPDPAFALAYAQIFVGRVNDLSVYRHGRACPGHPCGAAPANYLRCRKA